MKMKAVADGGIEGEEVIDALAVQAAGATNQSVHLVFGFAEEELCEIGAILAGDARDQRTFHEIFPQVERSGGAAIQRAAQTGPAGKRILATSRAVAVEATKLSSSAAESTPVWPIKSRTRAGRFETQVPAAELVGLDAGVLALDVNHPALVVLD